MPISRKFYNYAALYTRARRAFAFFGAGDVFIRPGVGGRGSAVTVSQR